MKPVYVFQSRRIAKDAEDYWKARLGETARPTTPDKSGFVEGRSLPQTFPYGAPPAGGEPNKYDSKRNDRIGREDDETPLVTLRRDLAGPWGGDAA